MIYNTHTVNIDGNVLNEEEITKAFTINNDDKFSRWVVRPLAILTTIGLGIAMFFASAFLIILSLATLPLLALSFWAIKKKVDRDMAQANPIVGEQPSDMDKPNEDTQTAS